MKSAFAKLPVAARLAAAGGAALAVAGGAIVLTAEAAGVHLGSFGTGAGPAPIAASSPVPSQSPGPAASGRAAAQPGRRVLQAAVGSAEAQVLGIQPRDLQADLKKGTSLHQLADARGLSQADFRAALIGDLTPLLDAAVTGHQVTSQQEQRTLDRLRSGPIPNWDQVARPAAPFSPPPTAASPSPAAGGDQPPPAR